MYDTFVITDDNLSAFKRAYALLRRHFQRLVKMTSDYPVECVIATYRFMLLSQTDIETLISKINDKLKVRGCGGTVDASV